METNTKSPPYVPQIRLYQNWLRDQRGLQFDSYDALWRWSTTELDAFWQSVWDYFRIESPTPHTAVLGKIPCPALSGFLALRSTTRAGRCDMSMRRTQRVCPPSSAATKKATTAS